MSRLGDMYNALACILADFNYVTLTLLYIFQKTVECKLPLLRLCRVELTPSVKTVVLSVQPNRMTLLLRIKSH